LCCGLAIDIYQWVNRKVLGEAMIYGEISFAVEGPLVSGSATYS